MKLTNNLLNNQNYILDNKKRNELLKFYYSIDKVDEGSTLWKIVIIACVIIFCLFFIMIWISKAFWEVYLFISFPLWFSLFYLIPMLFSSFKHEYLKKTYFIVFNTYLDKEHLEIIYKKSALNVFTKKYFYRIQVQYLKWMSNSIKKHMKKYNYKNLDS